MKSEAEKYLEESRENFLDRMRSQSPRKLSEEDKKIIEERLKKIEEYRKKHYKK